MLVRLVPPQRIFLLLLCAHTLLLAAAVFYILTEFTESHPFRALALLYAFL